MKKGGLHVTIFVNIILDIFKKHDVKFSIGN
jgi:hypothetical protein